MTTFLILLGGRLDPSSRLSRQTAGARVLAADSGVRHAEALGLEPELWLGDFDSAGPDLAARFAHLPRKAYPADKAMTDGEIAAAEAVIAGAERIVMAGAFGGRADHALFHLKLALRLAEGGTSVLLTSGREEAHPILPGAASFDLPDGATFSVLGFTALNGLSIDGARWPLDRASVPFGSSLTVSNRVSGDLRIRLDEGRAVLIAQLAETV